MVKKNLTNGVDCAIIEKIFANRVKFTRNRIFLTNKRIIRFSSRKRTEQGGRRIRIKLKCIFFGGIFMSKKLRATLAMVLSFVMFGSIVACGGDSDDSSSSKPLDSSTSTGGDDSSGGDVTHEGSYAEAKPDFTVPNANLKQATYRTTTATMPSNWNELTYDDNNDTQIISYISSSFFEYDFEFDGEKYNADGTINVDAIVEGGYTTNFSAAKALRDVTATVDSKWGYTEQQKQDGGYAWKITLRDDLKWDDGTPITADDFVYSMNAQLDPDFMNMRANTYYDTLRIKRSRSYFYKNQEAIYSTIGSNGYNKNADAVAAGETIYMDVYTFYNAKGYVDEQGNACPQWVSINDETVYNAPEAWADPTNEEIQDAFSGKELWDYFFDPEVGGYRGYVEVGASYEGWLGIKEVNNDRDVTFSDVGMYKVDDYSFVICLDKQYNFITEDGGLSYLAAYYMSSLPLVKESLYESCKKEPADDSTLWTTTYNTSLETTASWGPYKLTDFIDDKSYTLEKNPYWYGYSMGQYANQYNVTKIECECVSVSATQWLKFLAGETDDASLDTDHVKDYMNSKYTTFSPGTGTFAMQLFGDLETLKRSGNNNGILAIDQFRQAFSYALNRNDIVKTIWPGSAISCLGVVNSQYFYDVENQGVYRETEQAKAALLRAYGFTQSANGLWTDGESIVDYDLQEAYDVLTGYNPTLAKQLFEEAITELTTNAEKYGYDASKNITIVYGSSVDTAKQRERMAYLQKILNGLAEGTALEGKIELVFDASAGSDWADAFRSGATQIGFGYGFSGNPFNPFDIIGSFVDPEDSLNYHTYWNTSTEMLTLTLPEGDYTKAGESVTMSLVNWFDCLNGLAEINNRTYTYNWEYAPTEARLTILAALEEQVIKKSYSVMLIGEYSGSLLSPKFTQLYDGEYNTFMGYGGIRYMQVNYTDAEWKAFVSANGNDLTAEYKKAN